MPIGNPPDWKSRHILIAPKLIFAVLNFCLYSSLYISTNAQLPGQIDSNNVSRIQARQEEDLSSIVHELDMSANQLQLPYQLNS